MKGDKSDIVSEPMMAPTFQGSSSYIPGNGLISMLSSISIEDIPMAVKYLVDKLASVQKKKVVDQSVHIWDHYQLSPDIIAMAPSERKEIYGNYDEDLTEILEEKYNCLFVLKVL